MPDIDALLETMGDEIDAAVLKAKEAGAPLSDILDVLVLKVRAMEDEERED